MQIAHDHLRCPKCRQTMTFTPNVDGGRYSCDHCPDTFPLIDGLPRLFEERDVQGNDRLLRFIYDRFAPLHDPAVQYTLPLVGSGTETTMRTRYLERMNLESLRPRTGRPIRILEVGVGTGANIELVRARISPDVVVEYWGLDLSEGMLTECQRRLTTRDDDTVLVMGDAHALPFADGFFDRVFHIGATNNFREPRRALAEMARVAKPRTPIVIVDERLDPAGRHSLYHRAMYRLVTFYDWSPVEPRTLVPDDCSLIADEQIARFFYCLTFEKRLAAVPVAVLGTGKWTGGRAVSTRTLVEDAMPERDGDEIQGRIGIEARRWAAPETSLSEMAAEALTDALNSAGLAATGLRRIVLITSTGGDQLIPCSAIDVAHRLGLEDSAVDTYDVSNSCCGFLSALDTAGRAAATGTGPVALVAVEQFSRFIRPEEPRCYVIPGDAATAIVVGPQTSGAGIVGSAFVAQPAPEARIDVAQPARTGRREYIDFGKLDSAFLTKQASGALGAAVDRALDEAGLHIDDVDWALFHQPNGEMLGQFAEALRVPRDRLVPIVSEHGSIGVAAVPMSLHHLLRSGRAQPGDIILLASVGSGTVAGAVLYQVGRASV